MAKIETLIGELLYDHDCVIVPELGGFLASYSPANIHPTQHTFSPPSKKIAFNVFLKQNDGLLASHIAHVESLTYNEALKKIGQYVDSCHERLTTEKKCTLEKIGLLYLDEENRLQFEAFNSVNYLRDSFGLSAIQFLPVADESETKVSTKNKINAIRPSEPPKRVRIKSKKRNVVNALLLTGSLLWLSFNLYIIVPSQFNQGSVDLLPKSTVVKPIVTIPQKTITPPVVSVNPDTTASVPNVSTPPATSNVVDTTSENSFFVIAGAFRSQINAHKLEDELKGQGFANARVINPSGKSKMIIVSCNSFATLEEAYDEMNRLKTLKKEAWIYQH